MSRELSALITIGKRAFEENDLVRSEKLLREAAEGGANFADINHTLGLIYHRWGKFNQALERFERALAVNPDYTEALLSLSITLNDMGRYEEARSAYQRANDTVLRTGHPPEGNLFRGKIANLHAELGNLYLALGHFEDATEEFRKALRVAPSYPDLRLRLAAALREAGHYPDALAEVGQVLSSFPGNVPALVQQGILSYLQGDRGGARRAWEEALYREPVNKLVQLYLNILDREAGDG